MNRRQKEEVVGSLRETLSAATLVVVVSQTGMTVADSMDLRRRMRAAGATFKVAKNSLTCLAIKGTGLESLMGLFIGPTALAYSEDPVAAARVIVDYADGHDGLKVLGGSLENRDLDIDGIATLAKVPSLDVLRGRLAGLLQAPAGRIAACVQAPGGQVARVVGARARQEAA